ncbi:MAG: hypothetical protein AAF378_04515 [Cyanobacteria bacterium P01_A01_bin.84]
MDLPEAFISLIEEQPELFTSENRKDLAQQQWSDNADELGDQIFEWASARKNIYEAALEKLSGRDNDRLPGDGKTAPKPKPEDYKSMLLNAIQRNLGSRSPSDKLK